MKNRNMKNEKKGFNACTIPNIKQKQKINNKRNPLNVNLTYSTVNTHICSRVKHIWVDLSSPTSFVPKHSNLLYFDTIDKNALYANIPFPVLY